MKAVRIHEYGGPEVLRYEDQPDPVAGPGQILVRVKASSVNPVDWKIRSGAVQKIVNYPMPLILGGDIAGVVEAVGGGVTTFQRGDAVFAFVGLVGAYAGLVAIDAAHVARKPANLGFEEAASLPLVALTAWQGFFNDGRTVTGKRVIVHNAAGGVGSVAVQIAKAKGAWVLGTASAKNADFVRSLGADEVTEFRVTPVSSQPKNFDVLIDNQGDTLAVGAWSLLKPGGTVIRIAAGADAPPQAEQNGLTIVKWRVMPNGAQLGEIGVLAEAGKIRAIVASVFPLSQVAAAHEQSQTGHARGKIVLRMDE
jgi:NADPH:quinone reductase-like Zn-dependent oxidoreductase